MRANELFVLFVDLDGVMADLDGFLLDKLGFTFGDEGDKQQENRVWKEFNAMQDRGEPTFAALDFMPDARDLWGAIQHLKPNILTATGQRQEHSGNEKRQWVRQHLPNHNKIITVKSSRDKAQYAAPNHILIDDRSKSIDPWREAGGIGVHHQNAQATLDELRSLGVDLAGD